MKNPNTMHLHRQVPTLWKNVLPPSSGWKNDGNSIPLQNTLTHTHHTSLHTVVFIASLQEPPISLTGSILHNRTQLKGDQLFEKAIDKHILKPNKNCV
jgi:hypothetical protein